MPRARNSLFELGGQWIAEEPGRQGYYRFWYDGGTQRVRRLALGCTDLEAAKLKLAEIVLNSERPTDDSSIAPILLRYHVDKTDAQRSGKMARIASRKVLAYFGPKARISDLTADRIAAFARSEVAAGASHAYLSRVLGVIAAGLAWGGVRAVEIPRSLSWLDEKAPSNKAPRRVAIPDDKSMRTILCAPVPEPLFRWMLISLATGARPEAVIDFRPEQRREGLLDLNPPQRRQNKKHRPVVREPAFMAPWFDLWGKDEATELHGRYVTYASVSAVQTALDRLSDATGIKVSAYSFRHKVVTVLRRYKRAGVTEDDIAWQMGHKRPDLRVTGAYGELDPDFGLVACRALDEWLSGLGVSRTTPTSKKISKGAERPTLKKSNG